MQKEEEQPQEKKKRSGMTKYEKLKLRITVFVAVVLVAQAAVNIGSFVHFHVTWNEAFPEEQDIPNCICQETGDVYGGSNIE
ncbi:MAG: hypothetical protein OXI30_21410 [Chloroflexota bacterium]|nr:hypothetical protein [Chloroflexota bacterium]